MFWGLQVSLSPIIISIRLVDIRLVKDATVQHAHINAKIEKRKESKVKLVALLPLHRSTFSIISCHIISYVCSYDMTILSREGVTTTVTFNFFYILFYHVGM